MWIYVDRCQQAYMNNNIFITYYLKVRPMFPVCRSLVASLFAEHCVIQFIVLDSKLHSIMLQHYNFADIILRSVTFEKFVHAYAACCLCLLADTLQSINSKANLMKYFLRYINRFLHYITRMNLTFSKELIVQMLLYLMYNNRW